MAKINHLNVSGTPHDKDIHKLLDKPDIGVTRYAHRSLVVSEHDVQEGELLNLEHVLQLGWEPIFCGNLGDDLVFIFRMPEDEYIARLRGRMD